MKRGRGACSILRAEIQSVAIYLSQWIFFQLNASWTLAGRMEKFKEEGFACLSNNNNVKKMFIK